MNRPDNAELLLAYLHGELPLTDTVALEARLKGEPDLAERFVALSRDEAVLTEWAKLVPCTAQPSVETLAGRIRVGKQHWSRRNLLGLAVAACLLLAFGLWLAMQPPAAAPGPVAFLEDVQGEVLLVANGKATPVENGQTLFLGAELRTVGDGSSAVVRYPDAARLELSADTTARLENAPATKGQPESRRVFVPEGLLTAVVTQTPMVLATPHAEVRSGIGTFMCSIASGGTCVEPEKGRVQVTRKGQAMVEVNTGFYTFATDELVSKPRQRPTPVTAPQATMSDAFGPILHLLGTPEGRMLLSAGNDGNVYIWDKANQQVLQTIKAHEKPIRALALSPDGRTFVSGGGDRFVHVWDVLSGDVRYTLKRYRTEIGCIAFSPDGRTFAVGCGSGKEGVELHLYDVTTGVECAALRTSNPRSAVVAVAFSPDGKTLAAGNRDGVVRLWEVIENPTWSTLKAPGLDRFTLVERRSFQGHSMDVRALAFSPDGHLLATSGRDGMASVWRLSDGELLFNLTEHGRDVRSVAFSPDGTLLATAGGDGTARLWQSSDGQAVAIYRVNKNMANRALFSPDGTTLITCGSDRFIKAWKVRPPAIAGKL